MKRIIKKGFILIQGCNYSFFVHSLMKLNKLNYFEVYLCKLIYLLILMFIFLPISSANFACGRVTVSNDSTDFSASWFNVKVSYVNFGSNFTTCKVSPDGHKFCCDPTEIKEVNWKVGNNLSARIYEHTRGYDSNEVNLTISGNGYDLFSDLMIEKVLKILNINNSDIIKETNFSINISNKLGYNNLSYWLATLNNSKVTSICQNCVNPLVNLENIPAGEYNLTISASKDRESFNETVFFYVVTNLDLKRKIICKECYGSFIPSNSNVTINLFLNNSNNATGYLLELLPSGWIILDNGGGEVGEYNEDYFYLKWKINGSMAFYNYTILSPDIIITRRYDFFAKFNNLDLGSEKIFVYRFNFLRNIYFTVSDKLGSALKGKKVIGFEKNLIASKENPLIVNINDKMLAQLAIFPNKDIHEAYVAVFSNPSIKMPKASSSFGIVSNIGLEEAESYYFSINVDKYDSKGQVLSNFSFFYYNESGKKWHEGKIESFEQDEVVYFNVFSQPSNFFSIFREYGG